jgi:hypothetical protein
MFPEGIKSLISDQLAKLLLSETVKDKYFFSSSAHQNLGRYEFFFNAFKALSFNGIEGDYAEFGSCGAYTIALAHRAARQHKHRAKLWAFDSFQGLPKWEGNEDEHPAWREGSMKTTLDEFHKKCALKGIPREEYETVPGFYNESLPVMPADADPHDIALAYIDCDLYSSTKVVLEFLEPRLKHGMIIGLDDYFCYSSTQVSGKGKPY